VALIIGGEAAGAGAVARRRAQPVAIPMARATESLNAAVAGAVILFEAARQRRMASIAGLTGTIR
jgi:TrmH family RNA methyltransferase